MLTAPRAFAAAGDIVMYASDATNLHGNWSSASDASTAGGQLLTSADNGWESANTPLASPTHYFDLTFSAPANTPYHVWFRLRAPGQSKFNDSVFAQFSDAVNAQGAAIHRIGTANALFVNLQSCNGCPLSGWGWIDGAYWLTQDVTVRFASAGTHTLRVQTREDGVQLDEVVLSPSAYLSSSPGVVINDNTKVLKETPPGAGSTPYSGAPAAIPGTIQVEAFDNGGEGVAYHDTTSGNAGGAFRSTDVDLEAASGGGYDIGWVSAGEWLNYTVNVVAAGSYAVAFRVGVLGQGGTFHLTMNGVDVTGPLTVPNTGGWQNWQTVTATVNLSAGTQVARLMMDSMGAIAVGNFDYITFTSTAPGPPPPPVSGGATITVPAGGNLQNAIDTAQPGDTIALAAGAVYSGSFVLPAKTGDRYITIRSAASDAVLPPAGVRIGPQYAPQLAKIQGGFAGQPAFTTAPGAHHYRLQFLEIVNTCAANDIIELGELSSAQSSLGNVPHDLLVDRCYIHGDAVRGQKRGIALNSASTTIANSYISDIKSAQEDAQAIMGANGPGPYLIVNNYLEASGENILFGGADPFIQNLVPSDITIQQNYITKPLSWRGQAWTIKNLIELKNAQRVTINGNLIENNWAAAQQGFAVVLTPRNQDNTAPWSVVQQVQFTNNIVRHVASVFNILGNDTSTTVADHAIDRSNLFVDISRANWEAAASFCSHVLTSPSITTRCSRTGRQSLCRRSGVTGLIFSNNILPDNAWAVMSARRLAGAMHARRYTRAPSSGATRSSPQQPNLSDRQFLSRQPRRGRICRCREQTTSWRRGVRIRRPRSMAIRLASIHRFSTGAVDAVVGHFRQRRCDRSPRALPGRHGSGEQPAGRNTSPTIEAAQHQCIRSGRFSKSPRRLPATPGNGLVPWPRPGRSSCRRRRRRTR